MSDNGIDSASTRTFTFNLISCLNFHLKIKKKEGKKEKAKKRKKGKEIVEEFHMKAEFWIKYKTLTHMQH